jgi:uncharacterized membrane protein
MNEFFSWSLLATFAGASIATAVITQLLKTPLAKIPTQIVSYVIALVVLLLATAATGAAEDWTGWAIVPLNAILVSLASNGTYDAVTRNQNNE